MSARAKPARIRPMNKYPKPAKERWQAFKRSRACGNKRLFETEAACLQSIATSPCVFTLFAYKCSFGDHWHKTKRKMMTVPRGLRKELFKTAKPLSVIRRAPRDVARLQRTILEARKPYISLLVDLYARCSPAILIDTQGNITYTYPEWVENQAEAIREQCRATTEHYLDQANFG